MKNNFNGSFEKQYDLVVMGTGPGGATVARELAKRGKKVLMLEKGPHREPDGSIISAAIDMMLPGKGLFFTPQMAGMVRACCTGGSSIYFYASAMPPDLDKFKPYGVDLAYDTDEMYKDLSFLKPLPDHMLGTMSKAIMEGAQALGHDWKPIQKFIIQDKWTPDFEFGISCRRDIKWTALMYVREAMQHGAQLLNHANVTDVILENKKAVGVEFKRNGQTYRVNADTVVLAGGGVATPVIMEKLGVSGVGKDFFFDPFINVVGEHPTLTRDREIPMSCGHYFKDDGYVMTDLQMPSLIQEGIFATEVAKLGQWLGHKRNGAIMVKTRDSLGGTLAPGGWPIKLLTAEDKRRMKEGTDKAAKIMQKAGFKNLYKTYYFAAHPGGTVALGKFVDKDLKTQFDNLYVCDASVIPDGCGLPPATMIIALGKYLARGLSGERK